jgi:LuxR family transcriptional regulator, maltose regulon positive regulatory protein
VEPAVRSGTADAPLAPAVGGIVSRRELFARLGKAGRVTDVSAPPGSGKTLLLRSWIAESGLPERAAWVAVQAGERDPQRFWIAVADALRGTAAASALVRPLTAAPDLDGWAIVERLLTDLAGMAERVWLVIDDVHELAATEALAQLELLVMRAPLQLRFVLATRHDLRVGLHRLRLKGELTEIRAADLRFTLAEARALFDAAGVQLPESVLALLHARAEGWAAGLRLAALSLAGHPDPERFAAEFSGCERTVADYLLAEVLERQSEEVRRLLLRTSILERVSGELADLLTGGSGGERVLQDLERAGAFVVSLDAGRSWFRYHQMFADLLQLELRRTAPSELPALHCAAAGWFAGHGYPVEAVRHTQAAGDRGLAARLLSDTWLSLTLDGQQDTAHELLTGFPAGAVARDPELIALAAADELNLGSFEEAEGHLARATSELGSVPAERRGRFQVTLGILRLLIGRQRGDVEAVAEEAQRLLAGGEAADAAEPGLGREQRALALISLGITETWTYRNEEAERHLDQGVALARQIGRPYLELTGLGYLARIAIFQSFTVAAQRGRQAIELAQRHGWGEDQAAGVAYGVLADAAVVQGRLAEAGPWLERAGQTFRTEAEPTAGTCLHYSRGLLELARGRNEETLTALRAAERLAGTLVTPHIFAPMIRVHMLQTLVRLGQTGHVEAALAGGDSRERASAEMRTALASLRLTQHDPQAATAALEPVIDGSVRPGIPAFLVKSLLLEAMARDALGDPDAAARALERALDLAEPDHVLIEFLIDPAPGLFERHARHATAHAALVAEILSLLAGTSRRAAPSGEQPPSLREPLSQVETRVLRYLPTSLSVPEIAGQLYLSQNTARTHMRHIYAKLGTHHRHEAVEQARTLGLLAPSTRAFEAEYAAGHTLDLARVLAALGRQDAAAGQAQAGCEAEPAGALVSELDAVVSGEAVAVLTPRELDVLTLVAQGLSNPEIARRLVLSEHTVHRHLANIFRKLNLSTRAAAAAWGVRAGLV